jgi:hypothetical protein
LIETGRPDDINFSDAMRLGPNGPIAFRVLAPLSYLSVLVIHLISFLAVCQALLAQVPASPFIGRRPPSPPRPLAGCLSLHRALQPTLALFPLHHAFVLFCSISGNRSCRERRANNILSLSLCVWHPSALIHRQAAVQGRLDPLSFWIKGCVCSCCKLNTLCYSGTPKSIPSSLDLGLQLLNICFLECCICCFFYVASGDFLVFPQQIQMF